MVRFLGSGLLSKIDDAAIEFLREDLRKGGAAAIKRRQIGEIRTRLAQEKPSSSSTSKSGEKEHTIEEGATPSRIRWRIASVSGLTVFFARTGEGQLVY